VNINGILIRAMDDSSNLARRKSFVPGSEPLLELEISDAGNEVSKKAGLWN
jgi:hypothetical protein